jgi:hypothetical protein
MNPTAPTPPLVPPTIPPQGPPPLGAHPEEQAPIGSVIAAIEAILRQPRRVLYQLRQPGAGRVTLAMLGAAIVCSLVYGIVIGSFSGGTQLWAAPLKVATGLLISAAICLPSLYIFACLSGSTARLSEVVGLVAGLLLLMTILLIGFAPVAWLFSQSTESLILMGALHLVFWLIATYFGLRFLNAGFVLREDRSGGLKVWMVIFLLVMVQMTTALRPLIGTADTLLPTEKRFFLGHWGECIKQASHAER